MPGNEKSLILFLLKNRNKLNLKHLKTIKKIENPSKNGLVEIHSDEDVSSLVKESSSQKKADIFINGKGISLKQTGGSKAFNKFQRKWAKDFFKYLGFKAVEIKLELLDKAVKDFHNGKLISRDYPWANIFTENEYKKFLHHLMMNGNQHSESDFKAEFIVTAPKNPVLGTISIYSFDEYFKKYKDDSYLCIRRVWTNQSSKSESARAKSIAKNKHNKNWVFDGSVGTPRNGFDEHEEVIKTVYYLDIGIKY